MSSASTASEYDYRGRDFSTPENAYELAQLIAIDCTMDPEDEWVGCSVVVRGVEGHEFFSIPLQSSYLAAA